MSPQWFKKIRKQLERQRLTPASQNLHFGKKKITVCSYFSIFISSPFFLSLACPILQNHSSLFLDPKITISLRPKKALFHIKHAPTHLFPNPTSHIIIRKKVNRLPLV